MGRNSEIHAEWGIEDPDPRSAQAAASIEDSVFRDEGTEVFAEFVGTKNGEAIFRQTDKSEEWAQLVKLAMHEAERSGADTKSPKAVRAYLESAMRDYANAVRSIGMGSGNERELLPSEDWRIRAARRHKDEIGGPLVAAMLYREFVAAVNEEDAERAQCEAAELEYLEQQREKERASLLGEAFTLLKASIDAVGVYTRRGAVAAEGAQAAAKQAAANSQAAIDEMAKWRKWVQSDRHGDAPKHCAAKQKAIEDAWNSYKADCKGKRRATIQAFLDEHGADEIYTSGLDGKRYQLIELVNNEATLKTILHNAAARDSARERADSGEKSKSCQKRKRK